MLNNITTIMPIRQNTKIKGAGDIVKIAAQPIAKIIDAVAGTNLQTCGGCEQRRQSLNKKIPL